MKLSELQPHVKRVILATADQDVADLDDLTDDELLFCFVFACPMGSARSHLKLLSRGAGAACERYLNGADPFGDEKIVQDEPLPALTRPSWLIAHPELVGCVGINEATLRIAHSPSSAPPDEPLQARYQDLYERELHFGFKVPEYETFAATQREIAKV